MGNAAIIRETQLTDLHVPIDWVPITPGTPHAPLRAVRAAGVGNLSVLMAGSAGAYRNVAMLAGETRYGMFLDIRASGTTATGIEGGL